MKSRGSTWRNVVLLAFTALSIAACGKDQVTSVEDDISISFRGPATVSTTGALDLNSCPGSTRNYMYINVANVSDTTLVTFTSDDVSLATVTSDGRVQAVTGANGQTVITTSVRGMRSQRTIVNVSCNGTPTGDNPAVLSVVVSPHTLNLNKDQSGELRALVTVVGSAPSTVEWHSSDATCVIVTPASMSAQPSNGWPASVLAGKAGCTAYVIAVSTFDSSKRDSALITTNAGASQPAIITLTAVPMVITQGGNSTLSWTSQNCTGPLIASGGWSGTKAASGSEVVTPTQNTTYSLSCPGATGNASVSVTVTVNPVQQRGWHIVPVTGTGLGLSCTNGIGSGSQQFKAVYDDDGTNVSSNLIAWTATGGQINSAGLLTYNSAGTYTVSATVNGQTQTVSGPITGTCQQPTIVITPQNPTITLNTNGGVCSASQQFSAALSNGQAIAGTWSGAGISSNGLFTGTTAGTYTVTFTASDGSGRTASTQVFVVGNCNVAPGVTVVVIPATFTCTVGGTQPFTAVVSNVPSGQSGNVTWSSSDQTVMSLGQPNNSNNTVVGNCLKAGVVTVRATWVGDATKFGTSNGTVTVGSTNVCTFTSSVPLQSDGTLLMSKGQSAVFTTTNPNCLLAFWKVDQPTIGTIVADATYTDSSGITYHVGQHATFTASNHGGTIHISAQASIADVSTIFALTANIQ